MQTPSDVKAAALLAHVVSQMQSNVDFLVSQNYISSSDASVIMSRLPTASGENQFTSQVQAMSINPSAGPGRRGIPPPPPPATRRVQARAVWAYNEDGHEPTDLSFSVGDIIDITAEENEDWWRGRCNGREALFPSSYVEKITSPEPQQQPQQRGALPPQYSDTNNNEKAVYRPFMAAHHGVDAPPPSGSAEVNSVGLQQAPGQEEKRNRFGPYKSTLAHSAVGGVGMGAGAAIGSGLVRAIF